MINSANKWWQKRPPDEKNILLKKYRVKELTVKEKVRIYFYEIYIK